MTLPYNPQFLPSIRAKKATKTNDEKFAVFAFGDGTISWCKLLLLPRKPF